MRQAFQPLAIDWPGHWLSSARAPPDFSSAGPAGAPLAHWGGANDGEAHFPIRWDSLFLLDANRQEVSGEVWVAGAVLIY